MNNDHEAPGRPGAEPRWKSGAKSGVGTAFSASGRAASLVWFTLGKGIVNEVFYPRPDIPCIRQLGLIVTDGREFFSDEETDSEYQLTSLAEGVPAYRLINTCRQKRYRIEKIIFTHPRHHTLVQHTRFTPLQGRLQDYLLYALLNPHLGGQGRENNAWVGQYKGRLMLYAQRSCYALALACSISWARCSVGFSGVSDGVEELKKHKKLINTYNRADQGNVALLGEIYPPSGAVETNAALAAHNGEFESGPSAEFVLALSFGVEPSEAAHRAASTLVDDLDAYRDEYIRAWQAYQKPMLPLESTAAVDRRLYRTSIAVMGVHEGKSMTGTVASLSVPWGMEVADNERLEGGYHLVWPRDLVETAGGLLAVGAREDAYRRLLFLQATQEPDGHWPQNMWMTGDPFWTPIQLGETAMPILLVNLMRQEGFNSAELRRVWGMVRSAADFLIRRGPSTEEDRWERDAGYTPFTLGAAIAALLATADMADEVASGDTHRNADWAYRLREVADDWNSRLEGWLYVTDTGLAHRLGIEGYYARILAPETIEPAEPGQAHVHLKGAPPKKNGVLVTEVISPDALAFVRFGLRAPDDPRILNTVKAIDALLKVETPFGPAWHRYNGDEYGESRDGKPFRGHGKGTLGRAWPLLAGERAHYELAAGHNQEAERLARAIAGFANEGSLLPEQVWDADDIPEAGLFFGRPTGSAMPLVWAHAEYVKLCRSLRDGRVFDLPTQPVERYLKKSASGHKAQASGSAAHAPVRRAQNSVAQRGGSK